MAMIDGNNTAIAMLGKSKFAIDTCITIDNGIPDWFPQDTIYDSRAWSGVYDLPYKAVFGVYRWGTTPQLIAFANIRDDAVTVMLTEENVLSASGFINNSYDSSMMIALVSGDHWASNTGRGNANNQAQTSCPKVFLYTSNFTNLNLVNIPKE